MQIQKEIEISLKNLKSLYKIFENFEIWDFWDLKNFEISKKVWILQNTNFDLGAFSKKPFYKKRTLGKISVIISLKKVRFFINIGGKVLRYYFAYYFFFFFLYTTFPSNNYKKRTFFDSILTANLKKVRFL